MQNQTVHHLQRNIVSQLTICSAASLYHVGKRVLPILRMGLLLLALLVSGAARLRAQTQDPTANDPDIKRELKVLAQLQAQVTSKTNQVTLLASRHNCQNMSLADMRRMLQHIKDQLVVPPDNPQTVSEAFVEQWEKKAKTEKAKVEQMKADLAGKVSPDIDGNIADLQKQLGNYIPPDKPIAQADIDQKTKQLNQLETDNKALQQQLTELVKAHPDIDKLIADLLEEIRKLGPLVTNRSIADLQEDLAQLQKALAVLQLQKQQLQVELKNLGELPGKIRKGLIGRPVPGMILFKPDNYLTCVCRKQKVALTGYAAMISRLNDYFSNHSITKSYIYNHPGDFDDTINNLNLESPAYTMRIKTTTSSDSGHSYYSIKAILSPKYGDAWEQYKSIYSTGAALQKLSEQAPAEEIKKTISATDSEFRKQLLGMNPTNTVVTFHVWYDSFDTYLYAVYIAKKAGFHTRWFPYAEDEEMTYYLTGQHGSDGGVRVNQ